MENNDVWILVDRPDSKREQKEANIIDSRWVFKRKFGENGKVDYKARLVIRGFKDKRVYELRETYAPVSRLPLIRAVLSLVNSLNFELIQMDVKTAFLNGEILNDVYMEILEGVQVDLETRNTKMCKLKKSLYGLKTSPKRWNEKFSEEVEKLGLENDIHEPCLYTWRMHGKIVFILLYVDDMLIGGNDIERIQEIRTKLSQTFEMKDLGEPENFLGMRIRRDRKNQIITIDQTEYIERILERFNMSETNPKDTPMVTKQVQKRQGKAESQKNSRKNYTPKVPYREAIGSLLYLASATRPDITYAVNVLSRTQVNPSFRDWEDVKRVFRYLRGTSNLGLRFLAESDTIEAYKDSSHRDWTDSSSTSGYVITLFGNPIAWRSHKQNYATSSTCQTEYLAMSESCSELISLDKAIRNITGKTFFPITVWCDNKSAVENTEKEGCHKLKDFDEPIEEIIEKLRYREETGIKKHMGETHGDYIKYLVIKCKKIKVKWISTIENTADIMTKPLELKAHKRLVKKLLNLE